MNAEARLAELKLTLPDASPPVGNYAAHVRAGNLIFLSGQLPVRADGTRVEGKVGVEVNLDEAYDASRMAALGIIARLRAAMGSLDRVVRCVKLTGFVNAPAGFTEHPRVINGCSDLLVEVFGEAGKHARSAVGVASLPFNCPVEIEAILH
ncbi:MAG TPA: RidA family protein [Dehalococcoidia bacterium]|nr:RidA family protein [Dehalococcoidia bacterium]